MRRLLVVLSSIAVLTLPGGVEAADWQNNDPGSGTGVGGATGGTIWAGVQFGSPPASLASTDGNGCRWQPANIWDSGIGQGTTVERTVNGVLYRLFDRRCGAATSLVWIPQTSASNLAQQASNSIYSRLPAPQLGTAPPSTAGIVNVGMWYWTSGSTWRNISVTAWVPTPTGIVWATTTARPSALIFSPGDGSYGTGATSCSGPGAQWGASHGDSTPSSCMYTYRHSSAMHPTGRFPASVSILWKISWRSNVGAGGSLPDYTTTSARPITVEEIQALVSN